MPTNALTLDEANDNASMLLDPCARCGDIAPLIKRAALRLRVQCMCGEIGEDAGSVSGAVWEWNKGQRRTK